MTTFRRTRIECPTLQDAFAIAKDHGGWIARQISGDQTVWWYSPDYTASQICDDVPGVVQIGTRTYWEEL